MWALQEDQILLNLHRPSFQPICPVQQLAGASQPFFAGASQPSLPFLLDGYGADAFSSNPYLLMPSGGSYPSFPLDSLFSDTSNPQIQAPACSVVGSHECYSKYSCISDFLGLNDPAMASVSCSNLLQCMEPVSSVEESTALLGSFNRMHTLQIPYNLPQEEVQSSISVVQNCYNQQYDQICEMGHVDQVLLQNMMQNEGLGFDLLPDLQAVDEFSHSSVTIHHQGTNPSPFMGAMDCINEAGSPGCSSLTDAETDCSVHSDRPMKRQRILDNPLLQKSIAHNNFCKNQETQQPTRSSGQVEPIRSLDLLHSFRSAGVIPSPRSKILAENCTGLQIINKQKQSISSVEPQSIVARERRKKISERVSILQKLIPGGNKLDTASMLDEAIRFVKFLQLQVQVLESLGDGDPNSGSNPRSSSSLILSETMQHALFKHNRCIASIRQCPSENLHQALG